MANLIPVFNASTGLNTRIDPARIVFDPETGISDLAVAYNIDHDYTGRISRRKGFVATSVTDACHSLFCDTGEALMVMGTSMCLIAPDLSAYRGIATVTAGAPVSYAQVGNMIFWVNGFEKGYVQHGENHAWVKGTYYGPTSRRVLSDPPIGNLVASHAGRIYIASGSVLWISDAYSLNAFDMARGFFSFEGNEITMIKSVRAGMYVGTDQAVWFLHGNTPKTFQPVKAARSGAFKGTAAMVDLSDISPKEFLENRTGEAVMWTGPEGISIGMPDGQVFHLTKDKIDPLAAVSGAGAIINGRYVCTLAP
jgi:hypothetical protein